MNTKQFATIGFTFVLIALFAAACTPPNPTLTFHDAGDQCTYSGPNPIPYGEFTVDLVAEQLPEGKNVGYAIITLKEGKTIDDLNAYQSPDRHLGLSIYSLTLVQLHRVCPLSKILVL
jgi:hypothetical protein